MNQQARSANVSNGIHTMTSNKLPTNGSSVDIAIAFVSAVNVYFRKVSFRLPEIAMSVKAPSEILFFLVL